LESYELTLLYFDIARLGALQKKENQSLTKPLKSYDF